MAGTLERRGGGDVVNVLVRGVRYREEIEERGRPGSSRKDGNSCGPSPSSSPSELPSASSSVCGRPPGIPERRDTNAGGKRGLSAEAVEPDESDPGDGDLLDE